MKKRLFNIVGITVVLTIFVLMPSGSALAGQPSLQTTQRSQLLIDVVPGNQGIIDAYCQDGEVVTGGGFRWGKWDFMTQDMGLLIGQNAEVASSFQYFSPQNGYGWRVVVFNTSGAMNIDIEADVMCTTLVVK